MTNKNLVEASKIFGSALQGDNQARGVIKALAEGEAVRGLVEAVSSSDLARAFAASTGSAAVAQYAELPTTWDQFAKREVHDNFKPERKREAVLFGNIDLDENGGYATGPASLPNVPELTEYPAFRFNYSEKGLATRKNGARLPFSWEAVINDEWSYIASLPGWLAQTAKRTEETEAVRVLTSATGPNAGTFNALNGNALGTTGAAGTRYKLSLNALEFAKREIRSRQVNGNYVTVPKFALVVPTNLQDVAKRILGLGTIEVTDGDLKYTTQATNSDVVLVVNDYLTQIDKSANAGTTWYLVPFGGTDGVRDSIANIFLRKHETPELRISGNTGTYLGGGNVPGLEGSLLNDDIEYRVRHVVAGGLWYGNGMYASTGESNAPAPDYLTGVTV